MGGDWYFDGMAERYRRRIYGGIKGRIRLAILRDDLDEVLPADGTRLTILDAGGGQGQMAIRLAEQGHAVTLAEPSAEMLDYARADVRAAGLEDRVRLVERPIQGLAGVVEERFDLVLCHAVMEWMAEPRTAIDPLLARVRPGGHLSLMVYNARAMTFQSLLRGDFDKIRAGIEGSTRKKRFTPISPLDPGAVADWLAAAGLEIVVASGVRCFHDYMPRESRERAALEDVLEMERRFSREEPYRSLGRYVHYLCRRP